MFRPRNPPRYTTTLYDADIPYDSDIRYDGVVPILPTYTTRPVVTSTFTPRTIPTSNFTTRHEYVGPTSTDSLLVIINGVWNDAVSWVETGKLWNDRGDYVGASTFTTRTIPTSNFTPRIPV